MTSSDSPPAGWPPDDDDAGSSRTSRLNLVLVIVLALVSLAAAAGITLAINSGDGEPAFPPGYFGEVARLSQRAATDITALAPGPADRAACLKDDTGDTCAAYAETARAVASRVEGLVEEFSLLRPPTVAQRWHREYRITLAGIQRAFADQARAIAAQRLDAFQAAARRADAAVAQEIALSEQFNRDFAAQLAGT